MSETGPSKTAKSLQTRTKIMGEYLGLFQQKYWEKITVKEVCAAAGITRSTFYQYFSDIYDLMEQIEAPLLTELQQYYQKADRPAHRGRYTDFDREFDCGAPPALRFWFAFCDRHRERMRILLCENSDPYFTVKVKSLLEFYVNRMMDGDGMPRDGLRSHFTKAFVELHVVTVRTWLGSSGENFLSAEEIIQVLNTMRIGANYQSYREEKDV